MPQIGISERFYSPSTPWYKGQSATGLVPQVLTCAIGGHPYLLEPALTSRESVDYQRDAVDLGSQEPGEHALSQQGIWKRWANDWRDGAGQDYYDRPESDRARFRISKGVDIWTSDFKFCLLNDTRKIRNSANTNLDVLGVGIYTYIVDGAEVYWTTNPDVASPTWTAATIAGTPSDITTDGVAVYAAIGTDIKKTLLGAATSSVLSTYNATLVEYANGRLIAAMAGEIVEIDSAGASTVIKTHPIAAFAWTAVAGTPQGIFAGGNAGDRNEIYFIGLISATGGLAPAIWAAALPDGETLNCMTYYLGRMILGTSRGLRTAVLTDNGLNYGAVTLIPGGVTALELQGEDCWFSWTNYDGTSTGLGRARLSRSTTQPLVPAYASDLMATAQGTVKGVTTFGTKRYFAVSGSGIWAEFTDKVASGEIRTGFIEHGVGESKTAISLDVRHEPLKGTVALSAVTDGNVIVGIGTSVLADSLGPANPFGISSVKTEAIELVFTLARSALDATLGPCVKRWTLRSIPNPQRVDVFRTAIYLTEIVQTNQGEGHDRGQNPLEEYLYLKSLEAAGAPIRYQEGTQSYDVQVSRVVIPQMEDRKWTDAFDFLQGVAVVEMLSVTPVA